MKVDFKVYMPLKRRKNMCPVKTTEKIILDNRENLFHQD